MLIFRPLERQDARLVNDDSTLTLARFYTMQIKGHMSFQRRIGDHEIRIDDADIMTIVFRRALRASDMREILQEHDGKLETDGDLFVISDLRALTAVEPGARHALGARAKSLPGYCVAYMVSSFHIKLFLEVLLRAANFRLKGKVQHRFFDDAESARDWLIEMRNKRRASMGLS